MSYIQIMVKRADQVHVGDVVRAHERTHGHSLSLWATVVGTELDADFMAVKLTVLRPTTTEGQIVVDKGKVTQRGITLCTFDLVEVQMQITPRGEPAAS